VYDPTRLDRAKFLTGPQYHETPMSTSIAILTEFRVFRIPGINLSCFPAGLYRPERICYRANFVLLTTTSMTSAAINTADPHVNMIEYGFSICEKMYEKPYPATA
jgi:hypothetical protein